VFHAIKEWFDPRRVEQVGETPDYRFSLANERTFLAWIRTALALLAGGLVVAQLLPPFAIPYLREAVAVGLMVLGGAGALRAVDRWVRSEMAIRLGRDLPPTRFPAILAVAVAIGSAVLIVAVLANGAGS